MSKIILIETVSTFRHLYAVELQDDEPNEYALDTVVSQEKGLDDFAQNHIGENIFSHREITEEEYLKIFDQENRYLGSWEPEQKKRFIYKGD